MKMPSIWKRRCIKCSGFTSSLHKSLQVETERAWYKQKDDGSIIRGVMDGMSAEERWTFSLETNGLVIYFPLW